MIFPDQSAKLADALPNRVASPGFVLWLTGLSGSGKSTLATALAPELHRRSARVVELLDGDTVRTHLTKGLGFTREDRDTNVRRIAFVADLVARLGGIALVAAVSPYRDTRDEIKRTYANVLELHVHATVETCAARDTKGLYAKALRGELPNFTGVSDPYEPPDHPDLKLDTAAQSLDVCVAATLTLLESRGHLSRLARLATL